MDHNVCTTEPRSWLCVSRAVTIEAAENGTVVLDAKKNNRRVFYVGSGGVLELVGLNITGGKTSRVSARALGDPLAIQPSKFFQGRHWRCSLSAVRVLAFCSQGGGLYIGCSSASDGIGCTAAAHLSECRVTGNEAERVRARLSVTLPCWSFPFWQLSRLLCTGRRNLYFNKRSSLFHPM